MSNFYKLRADQLSAINAEVAHVLQSKTFLTSSNEMDLLKLSKTLKDLLRTHDKDLGIQDQVGMVDERDLR